jgi:Tfp pilus assembly protein PilF
VSYQQALRWRPAYPEAHTNLGNLFQIQGKLDEAISHYRQAIHHKPDYAEAYANLGVALQKQERIETAIACFQQALRLKPDFVEAHANLGLALRSQGKSEEAIASYHRALQINPGFAVAHNNLGIALQSQGKLDEALTSFQQAVHLRPDYAEAYTNMGVVFHTQGKLHEAVMSFQQALHHKPHYPETYTNLGVTLQAQGKVAEALANFQQAVQLQPQNVEAHWNRSLAWLLMGNFAQGWKEYEWRWKRKGSPPRPIAQPLWDGAPFQGRTLLIHAEQGLGDTLQFIRYLPMAQARGGSVIFECQPGLTRLLRQCPGIDQLIEQTSSAPPAVSFDMHIPLLSLPRLFRTTVDTIPAPIPYIHAEEKLVQQWASQFSQVTQYKIGICWQGNPQHPRDAVRSVPLAYFTPLASLKGISLYSLQKENGKEQLTPWAQEHAIQDLGATLDEVSGAFVETAAVIVNLDLVITVDTAIAHLAGALGAPVWVLLPFAPDWRWLLSRDNSPWYPTMRLFRQPRPGEWDTVFHRVVETLSTLVAQH